MSDQPPVPSDNADTPDYRNSEAFGLAVPESPFERDAYKLAAKMVITNNLRDAAKICGFDYSHAYNLFQSPEYTRATYEIKGVVMDDLGLRKIVTKFDQLSFYLRERDNELDGDAKSRIAAAAKIDELLGYRQPEEKDVGDDRPVINITLNTDGPAKPKLAENIIDIQDGGQDGE